MTQTSPSKRSRRRPPPRTGAAWLTHDGEPVLAAAHVTTTVKGYRKVGSIMCSKCGHLTDEPRRHYAIMQIECEGGSWITPETPKWAVR